MYSKTQKKLLYFMLVIILKLVDHNRSEVINAIRKIIQSAV